MRGHLEIAVLYYTVHCTVLYCTVLYRDSLLNGASGLECHWWQATDLDKEEGEEGKNQELKGGSQRMKDQDYWQRKEQNEEQQLVRAKDRKIIEEWCKNNRCRSRSRSRSVSPKLPWAVAATV